MNCFSISYFYITVWSSFAWQGYVFPQIWKGKLTSYPSKLISDIYSQLKWYSCTYWCLIYIVISRLLLDTWTFILCCECSVLYRYYVHSWAYCQLILHCVLWKNLRIYICNSLPGLNNMCSFRGARLLTDDSNNHWFGFDITITYSRRKWFRLMPKTVFHYGAFKK